MALSSSDESGPAKELQTPSAFSLDWYLWFAHVSSLVSHQCSPVLRALPKRNTRENSSTSIVRNEKINRWKSQINLIRMVAWWYTAGFWMRLQRAGTVKLAMFNGSIERISSDSFDTELGGTDGGLGSTERNPCWFEWNVLRRSIHRFSSMNGFYCCDTNGSRQFRHPNSIVSDRANRVVSSVLLWWNNNVRNESHTFSAQYSE